MKYLYVARSDNKKTGPIPQTYAQPETCPPRCVHYQTSCYAESFHTKLSWNRAKDGIDMAALCAKIAGLSPGTLWRHCVAGDLPGVGEDVDLAALRQLTAANSGRLGFTFTHKHSDEALAAAKAATAGGFTVNVSADNLTNLDSLHQRGAWPLVVTLHSKSETRSKSPGGLPIVVCPAQTKPAVTCKTCALCARPQRKVVVGFLAHGFRMKMVDARLGGKT